MGMIGGNGWYLRACNEGKTQACRLIINSLCARAVHAHTHTHTNLTTLSCSFWQRSNNLSLAQQQGIGSDRGYMCVQQGKNTSHRCVHTNIYTHTHTHTHTHAHNAHTCTHNTHTHRCACIQGSLYRDCQPRSLHFTRGVVRGMGCHSYRMGRPSTSI